MQTEPGPPDGATATLVDLTTGEQRFPVHQAARLGAQLASALAELHAHGQVHGSITPAAAVVAPGNGLTLRDSTDPALATPDRGLWRAYAAPEQLVDGTVTPASDVYALGGLVYLMLTGAPPFPEFDPDRLRERKVTEPAPAPGAVEPLLPAALDQLVRSMLDRDPARRPPAAEAARQLLTFAADPPATAAPVVPAPTRVVVDRLDEIEDRRTDPWVYVVGALVVAAVIALILVLALRDDSPSTTTVPAVTGLPAAEATRLVREAHLRIDTVTAPDNVVITGAVAGQTPAAGTRVDRGRTVVLTISSGAPLAPAPTPIPVPVPVAPGVESTTSTTSTTTTTTTTTPPAT